MRRKVKPNHRTGIPVCHVVFDTETTPHAHPLNPSVTVHHLHLVVARSFRYEGGVLSRVKELATSDRNEFWSWLFDQCQDRRSLWAWAHNLGFDLTSLRIWELLASGELSLRGHPSASTSRASQKALASRWRGILVTGDPPTILSVKTPSDRTLKLVDTMNWLPVSLQAIAAMLGTYKKPLPGEEASNEDWLEYCRWDVEILARTVSSILDFVRINQMGNLRTTVSSQAYAMWRHRCLHVRVDTHDDLRRKVVERDSYFGCRRGNYFVGDVVPVGSGPLRSFFGSRVESPFCEVGPVHRLDLVAAYLSVMAERWFPTKACGSPPAISPERLLQLMGNFCAVAEVVLYSPHEPWPVRTPTGTYWMVGHLRTTLCGPELLRALQSHFVQQVLKCHLYTAGQPFDEFVSAAWKLRIEAQQSGNALHLCLAKSIAVGLHGKFGQKGHRWLPVDDHVAPFAWGVYWTKDPQTGEMLCWRSIGGYAQRQGDRSEIVDSSPLIAAYVLSYHRERMRQARLCAGPKQVLYEDTDSLHVSQKGLEALQTEGWINPEQPGKFRVVKSASFARYWGHKHYQLDDTVIRPGISCRAVKDPRGLWHQTEFKSLDSILTTMPPLGPLCEERALTEPQGHVDGKVNWDGWVDPLARFL